MPWTFLERPRGKGTERVPAGPPPCDDCRKPDREEAARAAETAEIVRRREAAEQERGYWGRVAHRAAEMLDVLRSCGVNTREHGRVTLDTFDFSECGLGVQEECERFIDEARQAGPHDAVQGLYLAGGFGAGKTQLSVAIARELLTNPDWSPEDVVFDVAAELIDEVQNCYNSRASVLEVKQRRIDARVWILDDLGTERPTPDVALTLYAIVNARAFAPTVITSNLLPDDVGERNPALARVVSRLGPAYFRGVLVRGSDRRYAEAAD